MLVEGHADQEHWGRRLMATAFDNETEAKNCSEPGMLLWEGGCLCVWRGRGRTTATSLNESFSPYLALIEAKTPKGATQIQIWPRLSHDPLNIDLVSLLFKAASPKKICLSFAVVVYSPINAIGSV